MDRGWTARVRTAGVDRESFVAIQVALTIAGILLVLLSGDMPAILWWLIPGTMTGVWLLTCALRLRDMGRSLWIAPAGAIIPVLGAVGVQLVPDLLMSAGIDDIGTLALGAMLAALILFGAPLLGFHIWLAVAPGRTRARKGDPRF